MIGAQPGESSVALQAGGEQRVGGGLWRGRLFLPEGCRQRWSGGVWWKTRNWSMAPKIFGPRAPPAV